MNNNENIKELQKHLLDLYKELREVLLENKIPYFGISGTAIGAFREKGFIPWDDDIDIGIWEEDRPRFLKAISESKGLSLYNKEKMKSPCFSLDRVYGGNKRVITNEFDDDFLCIDVMMFVKEKIKDRNIRVLTFFKFFLMVKRYRIKRMFKNYPFFLALGFTISKILFSWIPFKWIRNRIFKYMKSGKVKKDSNLYAYYLTAFFDEKIFIKLQRSEIIELDFVDTKMPVLKTFPEDSKVIFGDIYTPPKVIKTRFHQKLRQD